MESLPSVIYVHDLRASGVVRKAIALTAYLAQSRSATLVAGNGGGELRGLAERAGVPLRVLAERRAGNDGRARAACALRTVLGTRPTVLVSMGNFGHPTAYAATRLLAAVRRVYVISNEIGRDRPLSDPFRHLWARLLVADAVHTVLVGTRVARAPVLARALQRGRATALPNGIDLDAARRLASAPVPHPWLTETVPVVIAVGRIRPQKNFGFLLEAFAALRRRIAARLVILGSGNERATGHLAARAQALGIGDDVLLAGVTDNVFAWLARAAVFVLPSRNEGSSNALLEALAVELPVVVSARAGDVADVLDHGRYGLIVASDDPESFAAAMARQLGAERVMPGGRARNFALETSLARYGAVIAAIADDPSPARAPPPRGSH